MGCKNQCKTHSYKKEIGKNEPFGNKLGDKKKFNSSSNKKAQFILK